MSMFYGKGKGGQQKKQQPNKQQSKQEEFEYIKGLLELVQNLGVEPMEEDEEDGLALCAEDGNYYSLVDILDTHVQLVVAHTTLLTMVEPSLLEKAKEIEEDSEEEFEEFEDEDVGVEVEE